MRMPRLVSKKLQASDARHFVGNTMFDRCARATCAAGVNMPKKELLENWTLASMIHDRHWRGTAPPARVVDVASGHGLLGWFLLALCAASQRPAVFAVDRRMPDSAAALRDSFGEAFPALPARHRYVVADAADVDARGGDTLVLALHACGGLSDLVIDAAVGGGASLCLVPCCHSLKTAKMAPERLAAARRAVDGGAGSTRRSTDSGWPTSRNAAWSSTRRSCPRTSRRRTRSSSRRPASRRRAPGRLPCPSSARRHARSRGRRPRGGP